MKKLVGTILLGSLVGLGVSWALRTQSPNPDPPAAPGTVQAAAGKADQIPSAAGTISLDRRAVDRMGLRVEALKPVWHAPQQQAMALVLSPGGLAQLASTYATDEKDLATAQASLLVAQNEFRRQSALYRADQTTSLKAFQAAQGALDSSRAQASAARRQLQLDALVVRQQWGPTVGRWLTSRSPALDRILSQKAWLVDVTLASADPRWGPRTVRLSAPSGAGITGRLVSPFPRTNPIVQGLNFLYLIPARPGFAPGLILAAELPAGPARRGVVIPASAVVWSSGRAWAYEEISPGHFQRLPITTGEPVPGGWFVTAGIASGDRVVTSGAEELFSAESAPGGAGEGAGDDD